MSKISELSDGGSLTSTDYLIAVRSGGNVKVKMDTINVDQVDLGDNEMIRLGNSQDLTMVHTSTQSIINQAGIGDLLIQKAGATKLTINATGIDVTGTVTADGLTVDGATTITKTGTNASPHIKLTESGDTREFNIYNDGSGNGRLVLADTDDTPDTEIVLADNGILQFKTANTERLTIASTGAATFSGNITKSVAPAANGGIVVNDGTNDLIALGSGGFSANGGLATDGGIRTAANFVIATGAGSPERMRISASGDLLVGTTDPNVHIGTASGAVITSAGFGFFAVANNSPIYANRLTNDGAIIDLRKDGASVGSIGTVGGVLTIGNGDTGLLFSGSGDYITPRNPTTQAGRDAAIDLGTGSDRFKDLYLSGTAKSQAVELEDIKAKDTSGLNLQTSDGQKRVILDNSGNLLVGTSSVLAGNKHCFVDSSSDTTVAIQKSGGSGNLPLAVWNTATTGDNLFVKFFTEGSASERGNIDYNRTGGQVRYNVTSDQRLKENIVDAPSASDDIDAIQVRSFDWIENGYHQSYGLVAQELLTVVPDAVRQPEDPEEMMGVDYSKLVPMMLKEIQSLRARIAALES